MAAFHPTGDLPAVGLGGRDLAGHRAAPAGPVRPHEKGGKQHAMRVIKRSPRRQARAGDRAQGRSAADSGFVSGDLAPLTRRWSQRKRLPVGRPCRQCPFRESGDRLRTTKLCDLAPLVAKKRNATAGEPPAPPAHYTLYWVRTAGRIYKSPGRTVAANFQ